MFNKSKVIIFISIFLLSINFIFAANFGYNNPTAESLGTFKQNNCINLIQTCNNCTSVNITSVLYPNSSQIISEAIMQKVGTMYNYTLCNTSILGNYIVNGVGDIDGIITTWNYDFIITPSGSMQTTAQGISSIAIIVLVLALTCIFGYLGWRLMNNDLTIPIGIFFIVLALLFLVYNVWLLYEFKLNYTGSTPDAGIPQTIFVIFMTILGVGLLTAGVLLFTKWKVIKDKFKNAIKPEKEDKDDLI